MKIISKIIADVLLALYQSFWVSFVLSVLFMFVYKQYGSDGWTRSGSGIKAAVKDWISWFESEPAFRRTFYLAFYTGMMLFQRLLNRSMCTNPLVDVIGTWGLYNESGVFTTDGFENLVLFIPFTVLLLWRFQDQSKVTLWRILGKTVRISYLFSLTIEMLQLFLRLGTWQLSDLFYNTLGGAAGGLIYYAGYKIRHVEVTGCQKKRPSQS